MIAVISDIHSNVEALTAVLADIANRQIQQIICLGDIVGYGPEPGQCLDLVRKNVSVTLMGNHDYAVLFEPNKFNIGAEPGFFGPRQQLEDEPDESLRNERWEYMGQLKMNHTMDAGDMGLGVLAFAHGSPRRPVNEYVFPDDVYNNPNKVQGLFDRFDHLCFVGHTHVPGVFLDTPDFYSPDEQEGIFEIDPVRKALINVGSVGQPRDRDNRASYVVVSPETVEFVRVAYDVESVVKKVLEIPELDDYLGTRLKEGR
jgi:predicted phosphodiesterase